MFLNYLKENGAITSEKIVEFGGIDNLNCPLAERQRVKEYLEEHGTITLEKFSELGGNHKLTAVDYYEEHGTITLEKFIELDGMEDCFNEMIEQFTGAHDDILKYYLENTTLQNYTAREMYMMTANLEQCNDETLALIALKTWGRTKGTSRLFYDAEGTMYWEDDLYDYIVELADLKESVDDLILVYGHGQEKTREDLRRRFLRKFGHFTVAEGYRFYREFQDKADSQDYSDEFKSIMNHIEVEDGEDLSGYDCEYRFALSPDLICKECGKCEYYDDFIQNFDRVIKENEKISKARAEIYEEIEETREEIEEAKKYGDRKRLRELYEQKDDVYDRMSDEQYWQLPKYLRLDDYFRMEYEFKRKRNRSGKCWHCKATLYGLGTFTCPVCKKDLY